MKKYSIILIKWNILNKGKIERNLGRTYNFGIPYIYILFDQIFYNRFTNEFISQQKW